VIYIGSRGTSTPSPIYIYPELYGGVSAGDWTVATSTNHVRNLFIQNTPTEANGDSYYTDVFIPAGTYTVGIVGTVGGEQPILSILLGATTIATLDMYGVGTTLNSHKSASGITVNAGQIYRVTVLVNGKNPSASRYLAPINYVYFLRE